MMKLLVLREGALLTSDKRISRDTKRALAMVQQKQIPIVLVSERTQGESGKIIEELKLGERENYMISSFGASMINLHSDEVIEEALIPFEVQKRLYQMSKEYDFHLVCKRGEKWITDYAANPVLCRIADAGQIDEDFDFLDGDRQYFEIWITEEKEKLDAIEERLQEESVVHVYRRSEETILCTSMLANEKSALSAFMRKLPVEYEDAAAIGNSILDVGLFSLCRDTAAMINSDPILKEKATILTSSNDEDGIAVALEKLTDFIEII